MNTLLIINYDDFFDKPNTITLDDNAGKALFDELRPLFEKTMANEEFWLEHYDKMYQEHNFMELDDLPTEIFMQAHNTIKRSDKPILMPYVDEIVKTMQYDPRYTA